MSLRRVVSMLRLDILRRNLTSSHIFQAGDSEA